MDVKGKGLKDVSQSAVKAGLSKPATKIDSKQLLARSLASAKATSANTDVEVNITKRKSKESTELRSKANVVINAVNVAEKATSEIDELVKSVNGIVDQVDSKELSDSRRAILNTEAKELINEIKKQADIQIRPALNGIPTDERFKIEQELEQTLQSLFKDGAENAFGISAVEIDQKENIINIRASVAVAKDRVDNLRTKLAEAKDQIQSSVVELEVAIENSESATTSVRDLDQALKLASDTKLNIGQQPDRAVAVSALTPSALELLR